LDWKVLIHNQSNSVQNLLNFESSESRIWLESIQKIFTVYFLFTIFTENSQCLTRTLEPGICKNFYSCNTLLDAIAQKRLNLKTDAYSTIRHCGFHGIVPIVCCPNKPVALSSKSEKGKEEHFNCLSDKF
jgi:Regulatory CLIP domain of proteinases